MSVTGTLSAKPYQCRECGHEAEHTTNHYGAIYVRCAGCSWKSPLSSSKIFDCTEPMPEGFQHPQEWSLVPLGDLLK